MSTTIIRRGTELKIGSVSTILGTNDSHRTDGASIRSIEKRMKSHLWRRTVRTNRVHPTLSRQIVSLSNLNTRLVEHKGAVEVCTVAMLGEFALFLPARDPTNDSIPPDNDECLGQFESTSQARRFVFLDDLSYAAANDSHTRLVEGL